jgi:hypothetical protein
MGGDVQFEGTPEEWDALVQKNKQTMAQQTAIEWLYDRFLFAGYAMNPEWKEQAKAMEKEQMIRFAIACHQDILTSRNAPEHLIAENLILFEQYYSKIYGK